MKNIFERRDNLGETDTFVFECNCGGRIFSIQLLKEILHAVCYKCDSAIPTKGLEENVD